MKLSEYASYDATGLADLIRRGEVHATEVIAAAREAIGVLDPQIGALVETWDAEAFEAPPAPFSGVPFLIKDLAITMKGRETGLGSRLAKGLIAGADSTLMSRFKKAGLATIGRTTTPEMAISTTTESVATGPTRNPWNPGFSAGGSSGGSAAAVAAGMVPMAHATDGGGSIRVPASATGLFGLKPTRGRVPNGPAVDEVWSGLAVQFALTRSVRDSAALLDAVEGGDVGEPYYIPRPELPFLAELDQKPQPLRIGLILAPPSSNRNDPVVSDALGLTAALCTALGHHVDIITFDLGVSWDAFVEANASFWSANTAAWLDQVSTATGHVIGSDTLEPVTLAVYDYGKRLKATDMLRALDVRNSVTRRIGRYLTSHHVLLSASVPCLPPAIGAYNDGNAKMTGLEWVEHVFTRAPYSAVANVAGLPAMSVPLHNDPQSGLPIGSQFIAGFGGEATLYRLAAQLEAAEPWSIRRPSIWAGSIDAR